LEFVGLSAKEKVIEFFLMVSGSFFYHLIMRPIGYFRSRKKQKLQAQSNSKAAQ